MKTVDSKENDVKHKIIFPAAIIVIMVSSAVYAQNGSFGLKASTLGAGLEAGTF